MPTIARIGPYRFFFWGNEGLEPPRVQVQRDRCLSKLWLDPVSLAKSVRFAAHELNRVQSLVIENQQRFLEAWNDAFNR